jgi:hypothetical protein
MVTANYKLERMWKKRLQPILMYLSVEAAVNTEQVLGQLVFKRSFKLWTVVTNTP